MRFTKNQGAEEFPPMSFWQQTKKEELLYVEPLSKI